ncbi:MAG: inositol monophosphatase [Succinivibrionaceae bacterium]|nr:inositol monophosphatase [Succinivibrionaceae bacterium]
MNPNHQYRAYLNIAVKAARSAGRLIVRNFENADTVQVSEKNKDDLVTNIDRECQRTIAETILHFYPDDRITGEENSANTANTDSEREWIVDPIDGTTNFVKGIPHVAVSIAVKFKGETVAGCVYDPILDELFTAEKGSGAQLNDRKIHVSNRQSLNGTIIAVSYPHRKRQYLDEYRSMMNRAFDKCADLRRMGTASLDLAYVAAGRLDGYFEACLYPWDFAAGELIVREAGGFVTDFSGKNDAYYENGSIVCGSPHVHRALLECIRPDLKDFMRKLGEELEAKAK